MLMKREVEGGGGATASTLNYAGPSYAKENCCESVILTTVVVVSLTLYTFWAARRGHDFNFLGPFLSGALLILLVFGLMQRWSMMIYGFMASIIFCCYIIYDCGIQILSGKCAVC